MIKQLKLDNFNLSYYDIGESEDTVILLHGFPSPYFFWNPIIKELLKINKRVISVEQRGYPLSSLTNPSIDDFNVENLSRDIESLITHLNISKNITLIAHDWGTIVGWAILQRSLVHIDQLISVCGGTEFPSSDVYSKLRFGNSPHYITSFQDPLNISHLVDNKIDMFIRSAYRDTQALPIQEPNLSMNAIFMSKNVSNSVLDKSVLDNYLNHFKNSSLFQPICWYSNIDKNIDLSNTWRKEVNTPVTFIFGKIDYTVQLNDKMINRLMSSGSNILIREVENAGHWLPLTHKESVLEHI